MLKEIKPSDYLSEKTNEKEKKISEYFLAQNDEKGFEMLDEMEEKEKKKRKKKNTIKKSMTRKKLKTKSVKKSLLAAISQILISGG